MECLEQVEAVHYTMNRWKAASFRRVRQKCRKFSTELWGAKQDETKLLAWRTRLLVAKDAFAADIGTRPSLYEVLGKKVNPHESAYQTWHAVDERENFLQDIGFQEGRMREIVHMQGLLAELQRLNP